VQATTPVGPPKCGSAQRQATQYDGNFDGNGDTFMKGTDAIIAAIKELRLQDNSRPSNKKKNKLNNSKKPRAPWRSKKKFRELLDKKLCVQCEENGHNGPTFPKFRAATRPEAIISHLEKTSNTEEESDSENEEP